MVTSRSVAPSLRASSALPGVRLSAVTSAPAVADPVDRITNTVPFGVDDVAGRAVGLYDENLRHPGLVRLTAWVRLERRPAGLLFSSYDDDSKRTAVVKAQAVGQLRRGDPFDLLTLVIGMACAWSPASGIYTAPADKPEASHQRRRALLRDSVERALAPEH